jgi:hypothetical protein
MSGALALTASLDDTYQSHLLNLRRLNILTFCSQRELLELQLIDKYVLIITCHFCISKHYCSKELKPASKQR